jgi:uncharacterized protein YjbJ (UPF0337 family)
LGWNTSHESALTQRGVARWRQLQVRNHRSEFIMDWDRIAGNWKQMTGKLKEQWGKLTDDDLQQIAGNREQLEGKIQERYGYTKDQARQEIDNWFNRQA